MPSRWRPLVCSVISYWRLPSVGSSLWEPRVSTPAPQLRELLAQPVRVWPHRPGPLPPGDSNLTWPWASRQLLPWSAYSTFPSLLALAMQTQGSGPQGSWSTQVAPHRPKPLPWPGSRRDARTCSCVHPPVLCLHSGASDAAFSGPGVVFC